jgi:hypothetical protein
VVSLVLVAVAFSASASHAHYVRRFDNFLGAKSLKVSLSKTQIFF